MNCYKIGFHSGLLPRLRSRYTTPYGTDLRPEKRSRRLTSHKLLFQLCSGLAMQRMLTQNVSVIDVAALTAKVMPPHHISLSHPALSCLKAPRLAEL